MDLDLSIIEGHTIPTRFLECVAENGDQVALRNRKEDGSYQQWTYAELAQDVARCAAGLQALGFGPGQRLVMMLRNRPEFHVLDLAAYFCGGPAVSIYNSSAPDQIKYLVQHSEATLAVADDLEYLDRFSSIREELPGLRQIGVLGSEVPDGAFGWQTLMGQPPVNLAQAAKIAKPSDLATLIYTSGTTGPSKAVMIKHENVLWSVASMQALLDPHPRIDGNYTGLRLVSYLPMAHIAERNTSHYMALLAGNEVTCCPETSLLAQYLREVQPNIVFGVPRVWEKLYAGVQAAVSAEPERAQKLQEAVDAAKPLVAKIEAGTASDEDKATYDFLDQVAFKNLRELIGLGETFLAVTGAAPMPRELQLWFRAVGVPVSDVYGMSESSGAMTWSPIGTKPGTVGKPIPGVEMKLGDDGEIMCRGGCIFSGYLNDPENTEQSLDADGWLHTGDIGQIDEDGYFRIVDRKKELIITAGGKNISPANLEAALKAIPLVAQACAIGDQRPFVSALLVLDPEVAEAWAKQRGIQDTSLEALSQNAALIAEIEAGLPDAMRDFNRAEKVKAVKVLGTDWLPDSEELTPTSKLKRRAIHTKYAAEIETLYAQTLAPPALREEDATDQADEKAS